MYEASLQVQCFDSQLSVLTGVPLKHKPRKSCDLTFFTLSSCCLKQSVKTTFLTPSLSNRLRILWKDTTSVMFTINKHVMFMLVDSITFVQCNAIDQVFKDSTTTRLVLVYLRYPLNPLYSGLVGGDGHPKTPEREGFYRRKECSPVKEYNFV